MLLFVVVSCLSHSTLCAARTSYWTQFASMFISFIVFLFKHHRHSPCELAINNGLNSHRYTTTWNERMASKKERQSEKVKYTNYLLCVNDNESTHNSIKLWLLCVCVCIHFYTSITRSQLHLKFELKVAGKRLFSTNKSTH